MPPSARRSVWAWATYDWANSAFSTTVIAGFFPVFFKQFWSAGADVSVSTLRLGTANSIASVIVAAMAPFLGAIADRGSSRRGFLIFFAMMGIVMTGALYFVEKGAWEAAVAVFIFATIGFASANSFYDSLLVTVSSPRDVDRVSALGFSLGYLGGGLLFAVNVSMTLKPHAFGLADASQAVRISFLTVSVWWAVFSIPIMIFVKEPRVERVPVIEGIRHGFTRLRSTLAGVRELRFLALFLVGYWFYIDGLFTITKMAVDYGLSLGFRSESLIIALLITQFVGFPSAILFGRLGERIGPKRGIYIGLAIYIGVCIGGFLMTSEAHFYVLAVVIGLVLGGVQTLSRSLYSRLIPRPRSAEFFGFYNMLGKFAAIIGPVLMGWVSVTTGNPRLSILSIIALFLIGLTMLRLVDVERGQAAAAALEERA